MSTWSVDTSQEQALADRLGELGPELMDGLHEATKDAGTAMRDGWRTNAKRTSGSHGKKYPRTIRASTSSGEDWAEADVYSVSPAARGYEYGSRNQPPHLDAAKAYPAAERDWRDGCDTALARALEKL